MRFVTSDKFGYQKAGRLNQLVTFLAPVRTYTPAAGQRTQYATWKETRAMVANVRGNESVEGEQMVAANTKRFTVRSKSVPGLNETMVIQYDAESYEVERIDKLQEPGRMHTMYLEVVATRKEQAITPLAVLAASETPVYQDFSEIFGNVSGNYVTVTQGSLISTSQGAELINQLLFVFRSGLRLTYGAAGDTGFTIDNANNRITPGSKLRGENLLVHQYQLLPYGG
jgi:head-tail adaptor